MPVAVERGLQACTAADPLAGVSRYRRDLRTRLNGVWVTRRTRENPAASRTSRSRASPAWPPSASPTS
jgi:hypothetical protein